MGNRFLGFTPAQGHAPEPPQAVPSAPRQPLEAAPLKCILHKALHVHPDDRYQIAGEMPDELRAWLNGQGRPFGRSEAELGTLLREKPPPQETHAFPIEKGVLSVLLLGEVLREARLKAELTQVDVDERVGGPPRCTGK